MCTHEECAYIIVYTRLKNKLSTSVAYIGGKMDVCASTGQQTVYI